MTIGSELQQAREQRGLTLVQISERTKIRVPVLRAIERDDFKQLPGGVIARGFVRLFAREVGLDADEIGARFTAEVLPSGPEHAGDGSAAHAGAGSAPLASFLSGSNGARAAAFALAVLVLVAGGSYLLRPGRVTTSGTNGAVQAEAPVPVPVGTSSASGPEASPAAAPPAPRPPVAAPAPAPAAKDTAPLRVDLHATDACWISVTADGEQVAFRSLAQGERLAVRATSEVVLRIGVPGNLVVSINEQRMPASARPGTPVTLRITPANYRSLLKP
jgi:cytoskeletal protein RodZ